MNILSYSDLHRISCSQKTCIDLVFIILYINGARIFLLSCLALVIKSLVASAIPLPTLIFDEIDAGISGDVALKMGNILRTLSNEHQVITITHSPQVAAKADTHYFVYKEEMPERTLTCVKSLDKEGRIFSIASMLSQNPPSAFAIENAKELLGL